MSFSAGISLKRHTERPMTSQTKTIAETNNFIVLDKYVTEWEAGDRYQSETVRARTDSGFA
jgi:type I restriction enzyme R subunit